MRKHSYPSAHSCVIAALGLVIALTACGRAGGGSDESTTVATDAVSIGQAPSDERAMATIAAAPPVMNAQQAGGQARASRAARGSARQISFGPASLPPMIDPSGAMLVRTGEAIVEVPRVSDALVRIRQISGQFGGFVANTAVRNGKDEEPTATLELRVPTAQFEGLVNALSTLGKVESVSASAQDVGEEYVDLGARAANAKRMEARLVDLLANRTGRLSDVLMVEHELQRVREEIERYDARLRWLERRAATSTLAVTLHEPLGLIDRRQPGPLVNALGLAWERTLNVIAWCIASLGIIVPLGSLIGGGYYVFRRARRSALVPQP